MGILDAFKKILEDDDPSGLNENQCFIKAYEDNWDHETANFTNPKKALKYLDKAVQLNSKKIEAYKGRGLAYTKLNNLDQALINLSKAIELEPIAKNYYSLGVCLIQFNQPQNALKYFDIAIKYEPNNIIYICARAGAYAMLRRFDLAILESNKLIQIEPDNAIHYVCRGYQYYELGKFQQAIADYDIAIRLEPNKPVVYEYRRMAQEKLQQIK
jgi:tetratricopeptide (TPR) repeat protein